MLDRLFPLNTLPRRSLRLIRRTARRPSRRRWQRKVDFVIPGIEKSGTSSLTSLLGQHPQICMSDTKEAHFFDEERFWRGKPDYAFYHADFSPKPSHKLLGEGTPRYMYWEDAPSRMAAYNPRLKTVIIVRNPIDRAYSHWNMLRSRGDEPLPFWEALQAEPERLAKTPPRVNPRFAYVSRGRYVEQLQRLWRVLPREQSLVFRTEELRDDPQKTLDAVGAFLGVDAYVYTRPTERRNVGAYQAPMAERERVYLKELFEPEIKALEELLGWDCSAWLQ